LTDIDYLYLSSTIINIILPMRLLPALVANPEIDWLLFCTSTSVTGSI